MIQMLYGVHCRGCQSTVFCDLAQIGSGGATMAAGVSPDISAARTTGISFRRRHLSGVNCRRWPAGLECLRCPVPKCPVPKCPKCLTFSPVRVIPRPPGGPPGQMSPNVTVTSLSPNVTCGAVTGDICQKSVRTPAIPAIPADVGHRQIACPDRRGGTIHCARPAIDSRFEWLIART